MPDSENEIKWGRNERGDLLIDGTVVERNPNFVGDVTSELPDDDEETVPDRTNAAVEGKEAEDAPPVKVPEPEPEKTEAATDATEPPSISEKQKYKLLVKGQWVEKEYGKDEIVARLQMAESYGIRNDELREKHKKIEPFLHVFDRPDFKEWLQTKVDTGEIPQPAPPAPPPSEEIIRYRLKTQDPEFTEIRSEMVAWAATLPDAEAELLNSNYSAFNQAYDHFKAQRRAKTSFPPPSPVAVPQKKVVEKAIAAKEVIKASARVEGPGGDVPEPSPAKEWEKEYHRLRRAVREGEKWVNYKGRRMAADAAWVMHRLEKD